MSDSESMDAIEISKLKSENTKLMKQVQRMQDEMSNHASPHSKGVSKLTLQQQLRDAQIERDKYKELHKSIRTENKYLRANGNKLESEN